MRKLLILWELPQFVMAFLILVAIKKKISYLKKYKDTLIYFVKGFPGGISLSFIIFLNDIYMDNPDIIKHEYGHSRQSLMLGWLYLGIVGIPSILRAILWNTGKFKDDDYFRKFPENWADRLGGKGRF